LGAPQKEKGLADLLSGRCKAEDVMVPYAKNCSLTLIPGGKLSAIPATLWSSTAAEQFFKQLKDDFDYILIDSSASASLSDSGLLAKFADGYVYVVKKAYAQLPALRKGVETLSNCGCRAIGSVLNAD
jgi:receptor protein-tyrosine kinase